MTESTTTAGSLKSVTSQILAEERVIRTGTGEKGRARQQKLGRLTARDRIALLLDEGAELLELNLWAAHGMYDRWGDVPAAGVITGIGSIHNRPCMIIANDATVKAGAFSHRRSKRCCGRSESRSAALCP